MNNNPRTHLRRGGNDLGIIYTRVSSTKQVQNGRSLVDQEESLKLLAKEKNLLVYKIIKDGAESGSNFDREGIKEVRYLAANDEISYVLVDEIDRIGRYAAETLYFIHELQEECDVKIISNEAGELDLSDYQDLFYVAIQAISSQSTNETSARRSVSGRVQKFRNKNWFTIFNKVPLGYKSNEDDNWISIDPTETGVAKQAHKNFFYADPSRAYKETFSTTYGLPPEMNRQQLKQLLGRPIYVGKPTTDYVDRTRHDESKSKTTVEDQSLRIISTDLHEAVRDKKEHIRQSYGRSGKTVDVETLVNNFGVHSVVNASDIVETSCPECDTRMIKNGQYDVGPFHVHTYLCSDDECQKQCNFPKKEDWDEIIEEYLADNREAEEQLQV